MAFIEDTFTATDGTLLTEHTGESGVTWAPHAVAAGQFTISGGEAYSTKAGIVVASTDLASTSYDIDAVYHYHTSAGAGSLLFGLDPSAETYYMLRAAATAWQFYLAVEGVFTMLDNASTTMADGSTFALHVEARPGSQKVWVDDVLTLEATDGSITTPGRIGLRDNGAVSPTIGKHIASVSVTGYAVPAVNAGANATIVAGDTVSRAATFTDPDSTSWTATVDYGEGAGPQAVTPGAGTVPLSHTYSTAGVYTLTVAVTDDGGLTGTDTATITVNEAPTIGQFVIADVTGTDAGAPTITLGGD